MVCAGGAALALVLCSVAGPAAALVAHWYTDQTDSFLGAGCGSTSQVDIWVPRNAFSVAPAEPLLGTVLKDDGTERQSRGSPRFTATAPGTE